MTVAKTVWTYAIANGAEVAENVIFFQDTGAAFTPDLIGAIETALPDLWDGIEGYFSPHTRLASISVQEWNETTNTPLGVATFASIGGALVGTSIGRYLPTEVSEVISLRTLTPGPSGRGRIYLPPTSADYVTTDGYLSTEFISQVLPRFAEFFTAIHDLTDSAPALAPWGLVVFSRKLHGANSVSSIDMGTVFDVQRRRRRQLVESYTSEPVTSI